MCGIICVCYVCCVCGICVVSVVVYVCAMCLCCVCHMCVVCGMSVLCMCVLCVCCYCCYVCTSLFAFLPLSPPSLLLQFPFFSLPTLEPCPSNVSGSFSPCFYSADTLTSLLLAPYFHAWAFLQPLPFPQEPRKPAEGPAVDAKATGPACAAALP